MGVDQGDQGLFATASDECSRGSTSSATVLALLVSFVLRLS